MMKWVWIAIIIYIAIFGALTSLRHYNFQTQTWDMGIFTQIMWNITHGNGPVGTLEFVRNHFAVHMSPFLFLLAPGFALFPSPYYLLIIQTLALALGAWPLYLLAKKVLGVGNLPNLFAFLARPSFAPATRNSSLRVMQQSSSDLSVGDLARFAHQTRKKVSQLPNSPPLPARPAGGLTKESGQGGEVISALPIILALAYLIYPSLHWVNWFDFHPISFLVPFFLAAFYFAETKQWQWMTLFLILAASTQEDAVLVIAFFGIYMIFKKEYKIGLLILLLSIFYFLVSTKLIMPYFGGGLLRLDRYAHLGGSFSEIFQNLFIHPSLFLSAIFQWQKMAYLFWLFAPAAFLPLLAPREWILLAPGLVQNLLTNYAPQFAGAYQYDSALIGGIFIATVFGLRNLPNLFTFLARPCEASSGWCSLALSSASWRTSSLARLWHQTRKKISQVPINHPPPKQRESLSVSSPSLKVREGVRGWVTFIVLCTTTLSFLLRSPIGPFNFPTELFKTDPRSNAFRKILTLIPPDAGVAAHTNMVPHIAKRERVYMLGLEKEEPDLVIMDGADYFGFGTPEFFQQYAQNYADSGKYNAQILDDRYFILMRKR